jgi:DNA-binding response OmpR family regulator
MLTHGPLVLNAASRRAWLAERPLDLSAREWSILEFLMSRVERVASKEQIIQAIADWQDELSSNAVEVYVSRLRSKLEPAGIHIRTVRGFGYLLEAWADAQ